MRADRLLLSRGMAPSRSAAQRLISSGAVRWFSPAGWTVVRKAGEDLAAACQLEVTDDSELRFVSRGGLKLEGALSHCRVDVAGVKCLDAGQGTGGFTDVLLQRGAVAVVGFDVGHGQIHPRLAADPRVSVHEGVNARDVRGTTFDHEAQPHDFGFVTGDLSFISLTLALPTLAGYLKSDGHLLLLIKPQFELQPHQIGKGGIVRDKLLFAKVEGRIRQACEMHQLHVLDYFKSPVTGGDGNTEFFVWARPF